MAMQPFLAGRRARAGHETNFDYGNATKIYLWYSHRTVTDAVYTILYMLNVYVKLQIFELEKKCLSL